MENSTKIIDRLSQYLDYKGETFNKLAKQINVSNSYFSKMRKGNGSLGSEIVEKILLHYEDLNPDWLLTGRGDMLNSEGTKNSNGLEARFLSLLEKKDEQMDTLLELLRSKMLGKMSDE